MSTRQINESTRRVLVERLRHLLTQKLDAVRFRLQAVESTEGKGEEEDATSEEATRPRKRAKTEHEDMLAELDKISEALEMFSHIGKFGSLATLVTFRRIMGLEPMVTTRNADRCDCGQLFSFDSVANLHVCAACGIIKPVLFFVEDSMNDVLVVRSTTSGTAVEDNKPAATDKKNNNNNNNNSAKHATGSPNATVSKSNGGGGAAGLTLIPQHLTTPFPEPVTLRVAGVRRFLVCFSPQAALSQSQITTLVNGTLHVHIPGMNGRLISPPPNAEEMPYIMSGETCPVIDAQLRETLIHECELVHRASTWATACGLGTYRLPCTPILVCMVLTQLGHLSLAAKFKSHKTPVVAWTCRTKLHALLELLDQIRARKPEIQSEIVPWQG